MQVSVETTNGLERRMTVQIPAEQIDQQVKSKLQQLVSTVRLDGFRPGKVPLSVVKQRFGSQVRDETAGELISSSFQEALQQENLKPAGEPAIDQVENEAGKELQYVATFEIYPEIEPPEMNDLVLDRPVVSVTDADVDQMIAKLRRQRASWSKVDREARDNDSLEIDFEGAVDGESFAGNSGQNVNLELGSKSMIPGFEEQLIGVNAGEERVIEVTFPADYSASSLAGKTASFKVTVHSVSEAELPEMDDEFARNFGVGDGGVAQLRGEIQTNMSRELESAVKSSLRKQVFDALLDRSNIDVPMALINSELDALVKKDGTGADAESMRGQYEDEARRRVSLGLLLSEIIHRNQLQVDPERVRETIEGLAQSYEKPEEVVQWYYSNQEMLSGVQTLVMEEVVVDWVAGQAKIEEESKTFDEVMQA